MDAQFERSLHCSEDGAGRDCSEDEKEKEVAAKLKVHRLSYQWRRATQLERSGQRAEEMCPAEGVKKWCEACFESLNILISGDDILLLAVSSTIFM